MFSVGLTGGIGSGKSTVAALFAAQGAGIVDTDEIAHRLTAIGGAAIGAIRAEFGADVIATDGSLDRHRMREHVFDDAEQRRRLENILHPMIRAETARLATAAGARHPYVMLVVPLLVEAGNWSARVDRVLVVDCDEETQIARVLARNGLPRERAESILRAQATRAQRAAVADDIIENSGSIERLAPQVQQLHEKYCNLARLKPSETVK